MNEALWHRCHCVQTWHPCHMWLEKSPVYSLKARGVLQKLTGQASAAQASLLANQIGIYSHRETQ